MGLEIPFSISTDYKFALSGEQALKKMYLVQLLEEMNSWLFSDKYFFYPSYFSIISHNNIYSLRKGAYINYHNGMIDC
jgi:hypothetical protein